MARKTMTPEERIAAYLAAPSLKAWKTLYCLIIPGTWRTMWQAWIAVDGGAPTTVNEAGFTSFPDAFTMRRGLLAATRGQIPVGLDALIEANRQAPVVPR